MAAAIPTLRLPAGLDMPVYGIGTWRMGESARVRAAEVRALRHGIESGVTLIDTAEMYGEGGAESVLGQAIGEVAQHAFVLGSALAGVGRQIVVDVLPSDDPAQVGGELVAVLQLAGHALAGAFGVLGDPGVDRRSLGCSHGGQINNE